MTDPTPGGEPPTPIPADIPVPESGPEEPSAAGPPGEPAAPAYPGLLAALLLVVLVQVLANVAAGLIYAGRLAAGVPLERLLEMQAAELGVIVNSLAFGAVIWFALRRSGKRAAEVFPLAPVPVALWLPMALTLGGGLLVVNEVSNLLLKVLPVPDMLKELFGSILLGGFAPVFLILVAPVTEELLFRGVFLRSFRERYGDARAIFWSSVFFGGIHLLPWQVVPAFFLGLIFAWWTIRSGSLWPALAGHAIVNGLAYFQSRSLTPEEVFAGSPQPVSWTLAAAAGLLGGLYMSSRLFRRYARTDFPERSLS